MNDVVISAIVLLVLGLLIVGCLLAVTVSDRHHRRRIKEHWDAVDKIRAESRMYWEREIAFRRAQETQTKQTIHVAQVTPVAHNSTRRRMLPLRTYHD